MDDPFTRPPWSCDAAGLLTATCATGGRTLIATLPPGAPRRLLAAAPTLLLALQAAMDPLEQAMHALTGEPMVAALSARNLTDEAIAHARNGYRAPDRPARRFRINDELPAAERDADERLLDAAAELQAAAERASAALAAHAPAAAARGSLESALRAAHVTH